MQTAPTNWTALWNKSHRVCYRINIAGVDYTKNDLADVPIIERPLMQEPSIGRCCTANLTLTIRQKTGTTIPKAAPVSVFCWLENGAGEKSGELELGHFFISRRSGNGALLSMTCRDSMVKTGQTYQDKTAYEEWPVAMADVVTEICSIMGVELDERTVIQSGDDYKVSYPNEETLITEILSGIAAAHGGNFVITESGKLRLVPSLKSTGVSFYRVNKGYYGYTPYSNGAKTVSRITLNDSAGNQFTTGDDTGIEIAATCDYATQAIVDALTSAQAVSNDAPEMLNTGLDDIDLQATDTGLIGRSFVPYNLESAYLDPRVEIGDRLVVSVGSETKVLLVNYLKIQCSAAFICDSSNGIQDDDEDEFPYVDTATQKAKQYIKAGTNYFGNSITRKEGFKSEMIVNGEAKARAILNAGMLALQQMDSDGNWIDCIYFDAGAKCYKINGSVDIQAQANDSSRVWYQTNAPETPKERDLWIDLTDGANIPKRWNGEEWVEVSDRTAVEAKEIAQTASNTVSGLVNRVSEVENKITADAIVSTVRSSIAYTNDLNGRVSTADFNSTITQLSNSISSKVSTDSFDSTVTQLSNSISSKVSAGDIASTINQTAQSVKIDASKIQIGAFTYGNADKNGGVPGALYCGGQLNSTGTSTGISANNADWAFWAGSGAFRVAQSGYMYANNASISGSLSAGNWQFNNNGSRYTNGSAAVEMKFDGSKAWFASSNCSVQYGSDYNYTCTIRGKDVRIATGHDNSAVVIEHIGSADDPSLYCEGAGSDWSSARGNLGGTSHRWDVCYVRSFHQNSSREVKHDIQDLGDTGEIVDALRPVSFVYNGADKTTYTGLIYEETLPVYPYICLEPKNGKPEEAGIDYTKLIPLLLNEVKHLRVRIAELER